MCDFQLGHLIRGLGDLCRSVSRCIASSLKIIIQMNWKQASIFMDTWVIYFTSESKLWFFSSFQYTRYITYSGDYSFGILILYLDMKVIFVLPCREAQKISYAILPSTM